MAPFIVCIDGLIGAGKSTLMKRLAADYKCFPEPLEEWTLLPFIYKDKARYGTAFQFQVLLSQFNQKQKFSDKDALIIVERCPWTSRNIFAPIAMDHSDETFHTYDKLFRTLAYEVDYFIYLEVDPVDAFDRIQNRSPIDRLIPLDYLRCLHDSYRNKLLSIWPNAFVVKDAPPDVVEKEVRAFLAKIAASIALDI